MSQADAVPDRKPRITAAWAKVLELVEFVKLQHTLFALPFAVVAACAAARDRLTAEQIGWILLAMAGARSSAMGFNRIVDREIDRRNPRTASRSLPAGRLSLAEAWAFVLVATALFVFAASQLNRLAVMLSPVALAVIWGYSYTKRFTTLSHLILGLALGIAPSGAWIAVRGTLELPALVLSAAVMLWTAGFDIIYACQDVEFDRKLALFSLPARLGIAPALKVSEALHAVMLALLVWLRFLLELGAWYDGGLVLAALLLAYQHRIVRPDDLSRVNAAFFTSNGILSVVFAVLAVVDIYV
ncbi:MAG: UbiA-like polyprenyltransferase [Armatimonadota bacterium]